MTPDDLVEIEQIKRLKYRYLRCLDQKLWDELEDCFEPEATASYGGGAYVHDGRDPILDFIRHLDGRHDDADQPPLSPPRDRPRRRHRPRAPGRSRTSWS